MIEQISNLAERLATNVSESRRGFLARAGQAALGVAGVLGGLLALPEAAQAAGHTGYCEVKLGPGGLWGSNGRCVDVTKCKVGLDYTSCVGGVSRPIGRCGTTVSYVRCSF